MNCLHKHNPVGGFVGQHRRFCGHHNCDSEATSHVAVGAPNPFWCANLCNQHTKYYRTRQDAEVSDQLVLIGEEKDERKQTKRRVIAAS